MPVNVKPGEETVLREIIALPHIVDYCQQWVEVHGRPHTCARLNDHSGKHQVAVPQVGLVKW